MKLSNETYDLLKKVMFRMPTIILVLVGLWMIWDLPYKTQVYMSLLFLNSALGWSLDFSCMNYTSPDHHDEGEM